MILEQLTTDHFKGLPDREFDFCEGITLVVGPNRAGKSSLHQALLTALFGLGKADDGLASQWKDVLPWHFTGEGSVSLHYRTFSRRYLVERVLGRAGTELKQESDGDWRTIANGSDQVTDAVLGDIGIDTPSLFARTVSVAQGDLSDLEGADREEIGRALEEVLIGRSGATFQQALEYLDQAVRKPLRKAGRERILRKLDRYEEDASDLQTQIEQARKREEKLGQARKSVKALETKVPQKKRRLKELTGDPEQDEPLGLLTKLEQKRALEKEEDELTQKAQELQADINDVKEVQERIDKVNQQLTADESLRQQDLGQVEAELSSRQTAVAGANEAVEGCEKRIEEARKGLDGVEEWLEANPGFRDHAEKVKDAESALRKKREGDKDLAKRQKELDEFVKQRPKVVSPKWELVVAGILLLGFPIAAWLTRTSGTAWGAVIGGMLFAHYVGHAVKGRRVRRAFDAQVKVNQGTIEDAQGDLEDAQGQLNELLALLGISEEQAEAVLKNYRDTETQQQSLTKQMQGEEGKKITADAQQNRASNKLREFCEQFGLERPKDLRGQISVVRKLQRAEERKDDLLSGRSLEQIEKELNNQSVKLRGVQRELASPQYADFNPTTEEIEAWRDEAEELEKEVPKFEGELIGARRDVKNLEEQAEGQPSSHELEGRLEWLREEIEHGDRTVEGCYEADRLLREVQQEHRTTYLPGLERATSAHLKRMTEGFYSAVNLAACWPDITVAEPSNKAVPPDQLSGGSRDQLYFAFRLAVADQIGGEEALPLLLDEPFANFDSEHWDRALDILTDLGSSGRQVIYFTMGHEVQRLLSRRALGKFPVKAIHLPNESTQHPSQEANTE